MLSPKHARAAWQERMRATGAGVIMTYGSAAEIGSTDFEGPHLYSTLLPTTTSPSMFNHGYLASRTFIEAYRMHKGQPLDFDTLLGKAILEKPDFGDGTARLDAVFNHQS